MRESWKRLRYRLEYWGVLLVARGVPLLSRGACVRLSRWLGAATYWLDGRGRAVALSNLEAAFGGEYSPAQRRRIARCSYQGFARTMLDLLWARRLTPENYGEYMRIENKGVLDEARKQGRGIVMLCTHAVNFEWASLASGFCGFPATMVAQAFKNPAVGEVFFHLRQISGNRLIPQERSAVRMLKHVKTGGMTGMLIDLNQKPGQASALIEAFGMKMCVTLLHAMLADRGGALLVPCEADPLPDGVTRLIVHPPLEIAPGASLREIAQACWDVFEPILREKPHLWLWPYKHWRYKPADAARPYPFYANVSPQFEKLLRETTKS